MKKTEFAIRTIILGTAILIVMALMASCATTKHPSMWNRQHSRKVERAVKKAVRTPNAKLNRIHNSRHYNEICVDIKF